MAEPLKLGFKADEIIKTGKVTRPQISKLRQKLSTLEIPELTDEQCVIFLLSCDGNIDCTVRTVNEFFKARCDGPELFNDRNIEEPDLQYQLNVVEYSIFPTRLDDGSAILFHRLHDTYFTNYQMEPSMKLLFMTLDAAIYNDTPPTGLVILFDMKGVGLMHLTRIKMSAIKKFCHYLQEGLPIKLKEIHVLNAAYFIDKVMAILKPFIKTELYEQLHFHPPSMDMEKFYATYIPKRCMPEDFGGELPNTRILHKDNTLKLESMRPYFDAEENLRMSYYKLKKKK